MFRKYLALAAVTAMISATPALAGTSESSGSKSRDLNEVVCEKIEVVGSRLATKKICMTRAEWAERRREQRQEIDRAQISRGSCEQCQ
jgi:hypothetical protein